MLYHHQKYKNFLDSKKDVEILWVNIPHNHNSIILNYDTIVQIPIDTFISPEYKEIVFSLDKTNIEGNVVVLYQLLNYSNHSIYLYHTTYAHNPFSYNIIFKYPNYMLVVKSPTDKSYRNINCTSVLNNFETMKASLKINKSPISKKLQNKVSIILKNAMKTNIMNWNAVMVKQIDSVNCK